MSQSKKPLSGIVKHGVEKFFGIADNDEKWKANASRMHASCVVLRSGTSKTKPLTAAEYALDGTDDVEQPIQLQRMQTYAAEPGCYDTVDSGGSSTASVSHGAPHPLDPLAKPLIPDCIISTDQPSKRMKRDPIKSRPPKESIWKMAKGGMHYLKDVGAAEECMRSVKPSEIRNLAPEPGKIDISFFDKPVATGAKTKPVEPVAKAAQAVAGPWDETDTAPLLTGWEHTEKGLRIPKRPSEVRAAPRAAAPVALRANVDVDEDQIEGSETDGRAYDEPDGKILDAARYIEREFVEEFWDNTNRHEAGVGFLGSCFGVTRVRKLDVNTKERLAELDANTYRPFFTYWVTFVQIVCFIVSVSIYGIATPGGAVTTVSGEVLTSSLSIEQVSYTEDSNFWIGPRQADLIHMGAKYSPCMRDDENVRQAILQLKEIENRTACCVLNDGSGCVQTTEAKCSKSLATWMKWTSDSTGPDKRTSGTVCGQDPRYCQVPASSGAYVWEDDITKWPICQVQDNVTSYDESLRHMTVPLAGRPCCVGVQGQCVITTREFCEFRRGYFHEEANLCSQVSCLSEICGMIPFYNPDKPDQFYRLWTSLFIHAGIFQLLVSVVFQLVLMRDLEKFLGWLRICIIYCVCGIAGSLGSAIFIPYHIEAGPSGSQFGLLALFYVEIIQYWKTLENKCFAMAWLIGITIFLFALGLLPMIDNYAHLIGFVFGFPLGFALMPNIWFGMNSKIRKVVSVICCLVVTVAMLAILIVLFYVIGVYQCPGCQWFNCVPLTATFCTTSEVKISLEAEY